MCVRKMMLAGFAGVILVAAPMSAEAGGLFGKGGLIRGDVGKFLDPVEKTILTPGARTTAVLIPTVIAVAYGGPAAAPIGVAVGKGTNDLFAGKGGEPKEQPQQQVAMGGKCMTATSGAFDLSASAPVGSACAVKLPNGFEHKGSVGS